MHFLLDFAIANYYITLEFKTTKGNKMIHFSCGHSGDFGTGKREVRLNKLCYNCKKSLIGKKIDFVRFGNMPENGYSWNYSENCAESGVSVYLVQNGVVADVVRGEFANRTIYCGQGIAVGFGGDGELLVDNITTYKKATKSQIKKLGL